jgi:Ca2+-binding EF-hand superfamily protein
MGGSSSVEDDDAQRGKDDEDEAQARLRENSQLSSLFQGVPSLSYTAFLMAFALDGTPLTEKVFQVLDEEQAGYLTEEDLLQSLDAYRRRSYRDKLRWCFLVYDIDGNGFIDRDELNALLMDVNYSLRTHKSTTNTARKLSKAYERRHQKPMDQVNEEEFVQMAEQNPNLLIYPAQATMERILNAALHDPDDHMEGMRCGSCLGF